MLMVLGVGAAFLPTVSVRTQSGPDYGGILSKINVMIPMRDGVHLNTEIYTPKDQTHPLPFLITRTPYGINPEEKSHSPQLLTYQELIGFIRRDGYILVLQDIRGRYKSEGKFVMLRRPRDKHDPNAIDEGTDTYDTIGWLLKNIPNNNGRVGMLGISYSGWLTAMAMLEPHPALKAVSEQASPADMFLGDDFHHNGAFRLSYCFEYATAMETGKTIFRFKFDRYDTYEWYLGLGPLSNINEKYLHGEVPSWNDFVEHPNYDEYWQKQAVTPYLEKVTVPNLNVAGWWDQEDFYGPQKIYEKLEKKDSQHWNYFVAGPWNHGGWSRGDGSTLGNIQFGSDTSRYFREKIQAAWFAYWLKDKGQLPFREAMVFQTGTNKWETYNEWPPRHNIQQRKIYFHEGGSLSFDPPQRADAQAFDSYVTDPSCPVPYRHRPVASTGGWSTWLMEDQRFVHMRPDTLSWQTQPLMENVTVVGDIIAHLYASTSGSDSDWIVKLIDVYPENYPQDAKMGGYQLMIANEVFRARFRDSFEKPKPLTPNQVTGYTIDLHSNDHCFLKGHRIMVQVQSTWFPLIDRNPQKFVPNIYKAGDTDYQKAEQHVYRSKRFPSNIEIPVVP